MTEIENDNAGVWRTVLSVAERNPGKEALVYFDDDRAEERVSYEQLVERSRALAAGMVAIGVRRGDHVALWMTNRVDWIASHLASMSIGAVLVPVSTWLKDREVAYVLRQSRSRHLLMLTGFRKLDFPAMLERIEPACLSASPGRICGAELPELRTVTVFRRPGEPAERVPAYAYDAEQLKQEGAAPELMRAIEDEASGDDLAVIKYTSGSTSFPKGVMLEQSGLVRNAQLHTQRLGLTEQERWFSAKPLFHASGSIWGLLSMLTLGGTLVFTETFEAELSLELIERERCTVNFAGTTMLRDELNSPSLPERDLSTVRVVEVLDRTLMEGAMHEMDAELCFMPYGATEAYGVAAIPGPEDPLERRIETCGRFFDGMEHRVIDPKSGDALPPGAVGELLLRGLIMRGYFDKPLETAQAIDPDGWLHTGDLARVDADGYVEFVGRVKAMIKVGGENVAVEEVEDCVRACPGVRDCAVVGIPDERKTQLGRAYVLPYAPGSADEATLHAWCSERLAFYKVPAQFVFVEDLARTGTGKVDRGALEQQVAKEFDEAGALGAGTSKDGRTNGTVA
ncbi:MAG TPA: AMP-binding protein [Solirubrobacteraceae bacterium]|jgi:fatty-acyl-CoA synthase